MSASSSQWFTNDRYGLFIHWGPYAAMGRGEQVLFREHLDQTEYALRAAQWSPRYFDARRLAQLAKESGMRYAVFTTRHHDGYCLWDSQLTAYSSACQAPQRDFVAEYVEAFREAGLRVGLYYSLADWRFPAYWNGEEKDPAGWQAFRNYVHGQVEELLTRYGQIDIIWFDGAWPHSANRWDSAELVRKIRLWQPDILINNRLDAAAQVGSPEQAGSSAELGDFGTPEHRIVAEVDRPWESCQVTTWRLWGYARGEHYRSAEQLLDLLCSSASQGGNLLLNIGLDAEGLCPAPAKSELLRIGDWLRLHGEAVYETERGDFSEFVTYGHQTRRGNTLYLIFRFWPHATEAHVAGIATQCRSATLISTGASLPIKNTSTGLEIHDLPISPPCDLFPVIRLDFDLPPRLHAWAEKRLWEGDPARMAFWAAGETFPK